MIVESQSVRPKPLTLNSPPPQPRYQSLQLPQISLKLQFKKTRKRNQIMVLHNATPSSRLLALSKVRSPRHPSLFLLAKMDHTILKFRNSPNRSELYFTNPHHDSTKPTSKPTQTHRQINPYSSVKMFT